MFIGGVGDHCQFEGIVCNNLNVMLKLIGIFVQYRFSELMQRIFKYGDIQNTSLTSNKELNILV